MLAAILGAGPVADAFFVAFRLPNHFRAIFAGVRSTPLSCRLTPCPWRARRQCGGLFANRIFTLLFLSQLVLLVVAWLFMPQAISILAPGFADDAEQRRLAIDLTRITFPYLLLITLVTLYGGMLNVMHRFASAAAASIFLNLAMMMTLALVAFFPTAGHAAAWSVLISGFPAIFFCWQETLRGMAACRGLRRSSWMKMFARSFGAWACDPRLDGNAGRLVRRYHHRDLSPRWRAVGAVLRRPPQNQLPIGVIGSRSARYCCRKCRAA